jgi:phosphohistidine phosphatase
MFLYLMRHGEAVQGANDSQRSLSPEGRREVTAVAQLLLRRGDRIDIFYQSTKRRAKETAQIMKDILNPQARRETKDGLAPDDPVEIILSDIAGGKENVMIVSHMPFLGNLIARLVPVEGSKVAMKTGSVVVLRGSSKQSWKIQETISPGPT